MAKRDPRTLSVRASPASARFDDPFHSLDEVSSEHRLIEQGFYIGERGAISEFIRITAQKNHRNIFPDFCYPLRELDSIHFRHDDIADDEIDLIVGLNEVVEPLKRITKRGAIVAPLP